MLNVLKLVQLLRSVLLYFSCATCSLEKYTLPASLMKTGYRIDREDMYLHCKQVIYSISKPEQTFLIKCVLSFDLYVTKSMHTGKEMHYNKCNIGFWFGDIHTKMHPGYFSADLLNLPCEHGLCAML